MDAITTVAEAARRELEEGVKQLPRLEQGGWTVYVFVNPLVPGAYARLDGRLSRQPEQPISVTIDVDTDTPLEFRVEGTLVDGRPEDPDRVRTSLGAHGLRDFAEAEAAAVALARAGWQHILAMAGGDDS
jgi:hypothetical protein